MSWREQIGYKIRAQNPYEFHGPLSDSKFFINREQELEDAYLTCERITRGNIGGVFVLGGKTSGKTSFLNRLREELSNNNITNVLIPLDRTMTMPGNEIILFKTMIDRAILAMKDSELIFQSKMDKLINFLRGYSELEAGINLNGIKILAKWSKERASASFSYFILKDALDDLLGQIENEESPNKGIIFLFDEGDVFTQNRIVLEILRNVFQYTPGIGLVIAGTSNLVQNIGTVFSPVPRFFRKILLGPYVNPEHVTEAIHKPFHIARDILSNEKILLRGNFAGFQSRIYEFTRNMPMDINLICHFAYNVASKKLRSKAQLVELYMRINKDVLDSVITELKGTREYSNLVDELSNIEIRYMKILSKTAYPLSPAELGVLVYIDDLEEDNIDYTVKDLCQNISQSPDIMTDSIKIIESIIEKGINNHIDAITKNIIGKPMYEINDQWLASYFKIGWATKTFDIDKGFVPFIGGVQMYQDPISSMLHNIFFPKLANWMKGATPFKVLSRQGSIRSFKIPRKSSNRQYLAIDYMRNVDNIFYLYVLNLEEVYDASEIKNDMLFFLTTIKKYDLISKANATIIKTQK